MNDKEKVVKKLGELQKQKQKYYVILQVRLHQSFADFHTEEENFNYLATDGENYWIEDSRSDDLSWEERSAFTEKEIKDYDERYWPFAVKVEEMEE